MEVSQVYALTNNAVKQALGDSVILQEDLSNIVDVGTTVFDSDAKDAFCGALINQIGRMIFVNRKYRGGAPSVLMDGWEWGSVMAKVSSDLPEAVENESWELENGTSYDPNVFYGSVVNQKFFNKRVTFEINKSFADIQLKQSFRSADQYNGFISMLYNDVENAMTIRMDALIMRTINAAMAEAIDADHKIDLLTLYNTTKGTSLTPEVAVITEDFLKFASYQISLYAARMEKLNKVFNVGGKARFTPSDRRHVVLLDDVAKAIGPYTLAGAYNRDDIKIPDFETVPFWQGSDEGSYSLEDNSTINVKLASDNTKTVNQTYIIGVIFDRDALGVTNLDRRVTTNYNPKAEFYTNFYKFDAGYFVDNNEQVLVFTIEGATGA